MKVLKVVKFGVMAIVALLTMCVTGCSESKSAEELFNFASDDAAVVALMRPDDLSKSLGKDLPFKGVDTKQCLFTEYDDMALVVGVVTDKSKADACLAAASSVSEDVAGYKAYTLNDFLATAFLNDDCVCLVIGWIDASRTAAKLDEYFAHIKPIADWKRELLLDKADHQVAGLANSAEYNIENLLFTVELDGPKAEVDLKAYGSDGKESNSFDGKIGNVEFAKNEISADDMFAIAVGDIKDAQAKSQLKTVLAQLLGFSSTERRLLDKVSGGMYFAVNMKDKSGDMVDLENYHFSLGVGTDDGQAKEALDDVCGFMPFLPVSRTDKGYHLRVPGYIDLDLWADRDFFYARTAGSEGRRISKISDLDDESLVAVVNLPSDSPILKFYDLDFGIKAKLTAHDNEAELKIEFTGTRKGFLEVLADAVDKF